MKANEIKVGGRYMAKVSNSIVPVRVVEIRKVAGYGSRKDSTRYDVVNLKTNRTTSFRSAAKFRGVAPDEKVIAATVKVTVPSPVAPEYPMPLRPKTMTQIREARSKVEKDRFKDAVDSLIAPEVFDLVPKETTPAVAPKVERPLPPMKNGGRLQSGAMTAPQVTDTTPPSDPVYAEIREFEAKIGRNWWKDTGAEKMESWESFKKRGCPLTPVLPVLSVSPTSQTTQERSTTEAMGKAPSDHRYPGLSGSTTEKAPSLPIPSTNGEGTPLPKKGKAPKEPGAPSNKEIVYKEWLKSLTPPDLSAVAALVPDVQMSTVKSWLGTWSKGSGFPACAKDLPPSLRGTHGKEVSSPAAAKTKSPKGRK